MPFSVPTITEFEYNGVVYTNQPLNLEQFITLEIGQDFNRQNLPCIWFINANGLKNYSWIYATVALRDIDYVTILASGGSNTNFTIDQFTVGNAGKPADGTTDYVNAAFNNKTILISRNGQGFLVEGTDYTLIDGGGFSLIGGILFNTGEVFTTIVYNS